MVMLVAVARVSQAGVPMLWDEAEDAKFWRIGWRVEGFGVV